MGSIVIREGEYLGFDEELGYLYKLNGNTYSYKSGITKLV